MPSSFLYKTFTVTNGAWLMTDAVGGGGFQKSIWNLFV
jgi:hypothetical protein